MWKTDHDLKKESKHSRGEMGGFLVLEVFLG